MAANSVVPTAGVPHPRNEFVRQPVADRRHGLIRDELFPRNYSQVRSVDCPRGIHDVIVGSHRAVESYFATTVNVSPYVRWRIREGRRSDAYAVNVVVDPSTERRMKEMISQR